MGNKNGTKTEKGQKQNPPVDQGVGEGSQVVDKSKNKKNKKAKKDKNKKSGKNDVTKNNTSPNVEERVTEAEEKQLIVEDAEVKDVSLLVNEEENSTPIKADQHSISSAETVEQSRVLTVTEEEGVTENKFVDSSKSEEIKTTTIDDKEFTCTTASSTITVTTLATTPNISRKTSETHEIKTETVEVSVDNSQPMTSSTNIVEKTTTIVQTTTVDSRSEPAIKRDVLDTTSPSKDDTESNTCKIKGSPVDGVEVENLQKGDPKIENNIDESSKINIVLTNLEKEEQGNKSVSDNEPKQGEHTEEKKRQQSNIEPNTRGATSKDTPEAVTSDILHDQSAESKPETEANLKDSKKKDKKVEKKKESKKEKDKKSDKEKKSGGFLSNLFGKKKKSTDKSKETESTAVNTEIKIENKADAGDVNKTDNVQLENENINNVTEATNTPGDTAQTGCPEVKVAGDEEIKVNEVETGLLENTDDVKIDDNTDIFEPNPICTVKFDETGEAKLIISSNADTKSENKNISITCQSLHTAETEYPETFAPFDEIIELEEPNSLSIPLYAIGPPIESDTPNLATTPKEEAKFPKAVTSDSKMPDEAIISGDDTSKNPEKIDEIIVKNKDEDEDEIKSAVAENITEESQNPEDKKEEKFILDGETAAAHPVPTKEGKVKESKSKKQNFLSKLFGSSTEPKNKKKDEKKLKSKTKDDKKKKGEKESNKKEVKVEEKKAEEDIPEVAESKVEEIKESDKELLKSADKLEPIELTADIVTPQTAEPETQVTVEIDPKAYQIAEAVEILSKAAEEEKAVDVTNKIEDLIKEAAVENFTENVELDKVTEEKDLVEQDNENPETSSPEPSVVVIEQVESRVEEAGISDAVNISRPLVQDEEKSEDKDLKQISSDVDENQQLDFVDLKEEIRPCEQGVVINQDDANKVVDLGKHEEQVEPTPEQKNVEPETKQKQVEPENKEKDEVSDPKQREILSEIEPKPDQMPEPELELKKERVESISDSRQLLYDKPTIIISPADDVESRKESVDQGKGEEKVETNQEKESKDSPLKDDKVKAEELKAEKLKKDKDIKLKEKKEQQDKKKKEKLEKEKEKKEAKQKQNEEKQKQNEEKKKKKKKEEENKIKIEKEKNKQKAKDEENRKKAEKNKKENESKKKIVEDDKSKEEPVKEKTDDVVPEKEVQEENLVKCETADKLDTTPVEDSSEKELGKSIDENKDESNKSPKEAEEKSEQIDNKGKKQGKIDKPKKRKRFIFSFGRDKNKKDENKKAKDKDKVKDDIKPKNKDKAKDTKDTETQEKEDDRREISNHVERECSPVQETGRALLEDQPRDKSETQKEIAATGENKADKENKIDEISPTQSTAEKDQSKAEDKDKKMLLDKVEDKKDINKNAEKEREDIKKKDKLNEKKAKKELKEKEKREKKLKKEQEKKDKLKEKQDKKKVPEKLDKKFISTAETKPEGKESEQKASESQSIPADSCPKNIDTTNTKVNLPDSNAAGSMAANQPVEHVERPSQAAPLGSAPLGSSGDSPGRASDDVIIRAVRRCSSDLSPARLTVRIYPRYDSFNRPTRPLSAWSSTEVAPRGDIRLYRRRSKEGLGSATLPRGGRGLQDSPEASNGSTPKRDYPELRKRGPRWGSLTDTEKPIKQAVTSKVEAEPKPGSNVKKEDFPDTATIKKRLRTFEDFFISCFIRKFTSLPPKLQLSTISVAIRSHPRGYEQTISLYQYATSRTLPLDLRTATKPQTRPSGGANDTPRGEFILTVAESQFERLIPTKELEQSQTRARSDEELKIWLLHARDITLGLAADAGTELSRIYEYQISALGEDTSIRLLAEHAADCSIESVIKNDQRSFLDRNSILRGVVYSVGDQRQTNKHVSVILAGQEFKWSLDGMLHKCGLRKETFLFTDDLDFDDPIPPWTFLSAEHLDPLRYGYRGLALEWDFHKAGYKVSHEEDGNYQDEVLWRGDDIHRQYPPYRRLVGRGVMQGYARHTLGLPHPVCSLAEYLQNLQGQTNKRDEVEAMYRPLVNVWNETEHRQSEYKVTSPVDYSSRSAQVEKDFLSFPPSLIPLGASPSKRDAHCIDEEDLESESNGELDRKDIKTTESAPMISRDEGKFTPGLKTEAEKKKEKDKEIENKDNKERGSAVKSEKKPSKELVKETPSETKSAAASVKDKDKEIPEDKNVAIQIETVEDSSRPSGGKYAKKNRKGKNKKKTEPAKKIEEEKENEPQQSPSAECDETDAVRVASAILEKSGKKTRFSDEVDYQEKTKENKTANDKDDKAAASKEVSKKKAQEPEPAHEQVTPENEEVWEKITKKDKRTKKKSGAAESVKPETRIISHPKNQAEKDQEEVAQKDDKKEQKKLGVSSREPEILKEKNAANEISNIDKEKKKEENVETLTLESSWNTISSGPTLLPRSTALRMRNSQHLPEVIDSQVEKKRCEVLNSDEKRFCNQSEDCSLPILIRSRVNGRVNQMNGEESSIGLDQITQILKGLQMPELKHNLLEANVSGSVIGRSVQIRQLVDMLAYPASFVFLTGCHGIGKSAVAVCVGQVMQKTRTGMTCIIINCHGVQSYEGLIRRISVTLGVKFKADDLDLLCCWLKSCDQQLLLILDNLHTVAEHYDSALSAMFDKLLQKVPKLRVLCTSTRLMYRLRGGGGGVGSEVPQVLCRNFHLQKLDNTASHSLFLQQVPDLRDTDIQALTEHAARVPFAIRLLGSTLAHTDLDVTVLLHTLQTIPTQERHLGGSLSSIDDEILDLTRHPEEHQQLKACAVCILAVLGSLRASATGSLDSCVDVLIRLSLARPGTGMNMEELCELDDDDDDEEMIMTTINLMIKLGLVVEDRAKIRAVEQLESNSTGLRRKEKAAAERSSVRYRLPEVVRLVAQGLREGQSTETMEMNFCSAVMKKLCHLSRLYNSQHYQEALRFIDSDYDSLVDCVRHATESDSEAYHDIVWDLASLEGAMFLEEFLPETLYLQLYADLEKLATESSDVCRQCRSLCSISLYESSKQRIGLAALAAVKAYEMLELLEEEDKAFCFYCIAKVYWQDKINRGKALIVAKRSFDSYSNSTPASEAKLSQDSSKLGHSSSKLGHTNQVIRAVLAGEMYAVMLAETGHTQTAVHVLNITDDLISRCSVHGHPRLIPGYQCRTKVWTQLGLLGRAKTQAFRHCVAVQLYKGDHPDTAYGWRGLGQMSLDKGSLADSIYCCVIALSTYIRTLGEHYETGLARRQLGQLLQKAGHHALALTYLQKGLDTLLDSANPAAPDHVIAETRNILDKAKQLGQKQPVQQQQQTQQQQQQQQQQKLDSKPVESSKEKLEIKEKTKAEISKESGKKSKGKSVSFLERVRAKKQTPSTGV